jgi:hypothetical protein
MTIHATAMVVGEYSRHLACCFQRLLFARGVGVALPPDWPPVEPSSLGIVRRRLLSGRDCQRDKSGEADDPHRAGASLDRAAYGRYVYQRIKRGL